MTVKAFRWVFSAASPSACGSAPTCSRGRAIASIVETSTRTAADCGDEREREAREPEVAT